MHYKIVWGNVKQMHRAANPIIHNHAHRNTHCVLMNRFHTLLLSLTHTHLYDAKVSIYCIHMPRKCTLMLIDAERITRNRQITDSVSPTGNRLSSKVHWRKLDLYCTRPEEEHTV